MDVRFGKCKRRKKLKFNASRIVHRAIPFEEDLSEGEGEAGIQLAIPKQITLSCTFVF
jgi:hypothetical protein